MERSRASTYLHVSAGSPETRKRETVYEPFINGAATLTVEKWLRNYRNFSLTRWAIIKLTRCYLANVSGNELVTLSCSPLAFPSSFAFLFFFLTLSGNHSLFSVKAPRGDRRGMRNGGLFIPPSPLAENWFPSSAKRPFKLPREKLTALVTWHDRPRFCKKLSHTELSSVKSWHKQDALPFRIFRDRSRDCFARGMKRTCGTITYARSCQWLFGPATQPPFNGHVERAVIAKRCQRVIALPRPIRWKRYFREILCQQITKYSRRENTIVRAIYSFAFSSIGITFDCSRLKWNINLINTD